MYSVRNKFVIQEQGKCVPVWKMTGVWGAVIWHSKDSCRLKYARHYASHLRAQQLKRTEQ